MLSMLYSREAIERAKKRGRAYMCLMCETLTGEKRISELGPLEDHILKKHVSLDRVPFFCRLCNFKCQTRYQMEHHVKVYPRHKVAADQMGVTRDHEHEWMVESSAPYKIGDADMKKFTQEESILFFLRKQSGETVPTGAAPQMPAPTQYSNQMQMWNHLSAPITGGQPQQNPYSGNPSLFRPLVVNTSSTTLPLDINSTVLWGSGQQLPISPMLDRTMLDQYLENPVPNLSNQQTYQPLVSPQMFGASYKTLQRQPSPRIGGSWFRPMQPIGVSQGTPNVGLPPSQHIPVASQGNNTISQSAIQAGQGMFNLPLNIPMQTAPAASHGNGIASQDVVQASQGVTTSMLTIPTPSTQTPPAVSLGYGTVNQAAIQQGPTNFGLTMVTPPVRSSPAVSLGNLAAGQGPSSIGLATPTTAKQSSPAVSQSTIPAGQGSSNLLLNTQTPSTQISPAASLGNIPVQAGQGTSDLNTPIPSTQPSPVASSEPIIEDKGWLMQLWVTRTTNRTGS